MTGAAHLGLVADDLAVSILPGGDGGHGMQVLAMIAEVNCPVTIPQNPAKVLEVWRPLGEVSPTKAQGIDRLSNQGARS